MTFINGHTNGQDISSTVVNKREKRKDKKKQQQIQKLGFDIDHIKPLTDNQRKIFESYYSGKNLFLCGSAGTGKTFVAMYLSLKDVLCPNPPYTKIIVIRNSVAVREIGFLPGKPEDKMEQFELPYYDICEGLFGRGDAYQILKQKKFIEFQSTSFLRGITIKDAIIIVDEASNNSLHELDSIMTRLGDNTKIIFCGDFKQSDLNKSTKGQYLEFKSIIKNMPQYFDTIEMTTEDIVRSPIVKSYLITKEKLGL